MTVRKNYQVSHVDINSHYEIVMSNNNRISHTPAKLNIKNLPAWYNDKLFKIGQGYARRNIWSITVAHILGLLTALTNINACKILLRYTSKSIDECENFKRYLQTIVHTSTLYFDDISDPNSNWWKSLNSIVCKHARVSRKTTEINVGGISQNLMAITQFGFIGNVLLKPQILGFTHEPECREGFIHFWRVIGYLIGITDDVNICRENADETTALCENILNEFYINQINGITEKPKQMIKSVLHGLWYLNVELDFDAFMYFWYQLNGLKYEKPLNFYSKLNYMNRKAIFYALGIPYIQHPVRYLLNCTFKIILWLGQNFPILAWIKFGRKNSQIHLYSKYN